MRIINENTFMDHLHESPLEQRLYFDDHMMTNYHWANDLSVVKKFRNSFESDEQLIKRCADLEDKVNKLKEVKVWLSSRQNTVETNLHHVYECYLDPNVKGVWDNLENVMISCNDEVGPYSLLTDMRWFDDISYSHFVYLKLIKSWMCERQFRMGVNIPIDLSVHECPLIKARASYHQVSDHGVVLKVERQLLGMFRINSSIDLIKRTQHRPSLIKNKFYEISSHAWWEALGDINISNHHFLKILKNSEKDQKGRYAYLFLPNNILRKSKGHDQEKMLSLLSISEEIISEIA